MVVPNEKFSFRAKFWKQVSLLLATTKFVAFFSAALDNPRCFSSADHANSETLSRIKRNAANPGRRRHGFCLFSTAERPKNAVLFRLGERAGARWRVNVRIVPSLTGTFQLRRRIFL